MPNKELIAELRGLLRQRGMATEVQREYARAEEIAMVKMFPIAKPSEEKKFSPLRNLRSYIGENAFMMIVSGRKN